MLSCLSIFRSKDKDRLEGFYPLSISSIDILNLRCKHQMDTVVKPFTRWLSLWRYSVGNISYEEAMSPLDNSIHWEFLSDIDAEVLSSPITTIFIYVILSLEYARRWRFYALNIRDSTHLILSDGYLYLITKSNGESTFPMTDREWTKKIPLSNIEQIEKLFYREHVHSLSVDTTRYEEPRCDFVTELHERYPHEQAIFLINKVLQNKGERIFKYALFRYPLQ
jgi:hypothetical protein